MTPAERLLLEIETAKVRHDWAKAEMVRGGETPALVQFFRQSLEELDVLKEALQNLLSPPKAKAPKIRSRRIPKRRPA